MTTQPRDFDNGLVHAPFAVFSAFSAVRKGYGFMIHSVQTISLAGELLLSDWSPSYEDFRGREKAFTEFLAGV